MRKRGLAFLLFALIIAPIFLTGIVSANMGDDLAKGITDFINGIKTVGKPIFKTLLGQAENETGELFVIKILAFILVTMVIYGTVSVANIFGDKGWINFVIGLVVALIGIRFLPDNFLSSMAIPSSALVATIVLLLPLVVLIMIGSKIKNPIVRKVLYVTYAVAVILLWFYNYANENLRGSTIGLWMYPLTALACILLLIFDGTIQGLLNKGKAARVLEQTNSTEINRIKAKIEDLQTSLANAQTDQQRKDIEKQISNLKKNLGAMSV
ncbi:MAG: hypothetical protein AABX85_03745 [Nanoarchaeota archaeon]